MSINTILRRQAFTAAHNRLEAAKGRGDKRSYPALQSELDAANKALMAAENAEGRA